VRQRIEAFLRRLGTPGIVGLGILLACAGFYFSALAPLEQEAAAQRLALERLKARTPYRPIASGGRADELRRFYSVFPDATELTDQLERLHALARRSGLDLAQGEYRLERRSSGLWAYRVTLPARGSYGQFREFVGAVLKNMPIASLDGLRFERKKAVETQLEGQLRLTIYARPPGDLP
jgi:type IV pilus assembly PilO-like protein